MIYSLSACRETVSLDALRGRFSARVSIIAQTMLVLIC